LRIGLVGWVLVASCIGTLIILAFLAISTNRGFEENDRLRHLVTDSYDARSALQELMTLHQDIEIGQRGYAITGDTAFLEPYRIAEAQVEGQLNAVAARTSKIGSTQLVAQLRQASRDKRDFAKRTIALVADGRRGEAQRLIATGAGKVLMDRVRGLVEELSEVERLMLDRSTANAETDRQKLQGRTLGLEIGLILLLTLAGLLVLRSQLSRQSALRRASDMAARQEAIFDSSMDGMIVLNPSGSIESINPAAASMFGASASSLLRRDIGILFEVAPDRGQIETFLARLKAKRSENKGRIQEFFGRRSDGTIFPLEVSVSPVDLADRTSFVAVLRDVSERREVEQMKSEFVATVSHELRTPLTSIAGSLGLINGGAAGEVSPKVGRLIEIAHSNAARLVRLINDILDIEKIEAGRMQFDVRPLALAPLLDAAVHQAAGFAGQYDIALRIEPFPPNAGVLADEDRLMQVMTNLLSNAIKFSRRGETVTVAVRPLDRRYRISVTDCGEGISEVFRARIFQKFAQADASDSRQKGGTGLGLSIVKEIVTRLGGSISFDTVEGRGTVFHVDLPAAELHGPVAIEARPQERREPEPSLPTILHVDDDPDMLAVVGSAFEGKALLHSTQSMSQARAFIRRSKYDAAILDVGMLDGCGTDLVAPLRERSPTVPIMLFTAQEVEPVARNGIDLVLVKSRASLDTLVDQTIDLIEARKNKGIGP